ncbi:MAG TPA: hypothetical protein G4O08_04290 [Anaerolineae bacterium]|nr:hypothetical protein [Anaerolineae bacterium]
MKDVLLCAAGLAAVFIGPAIIIALVWGRAIRRGRRTHEAWMRLADLHGLKYLQDVNVLGMPVAGSMRGVYRDRDISLASVREDSILALTEAWFFRFRIDLRTKHPDKVFHAREDPFSRLSPASWKIGVVEKRIEAKVHARDYGFEFWQQNLDVLIDIADEIDTEERH